MSATIAVTKFTDSSSVPSFRIVCTGLSPGIVTVSLLGKGNGYGAQPFDHRAVPVSGNLDINTIIPPAIAGTPPVALVGNFTVSAASGYTYASQDISLP